MNRSANDEVNRVVLQSDAILTGNYTGPIPAIPNKCATREFAEAVGCEVSDPVAQNRLVTAIQVYPANKEVDHMFVVSIGLDQSIYQASLRCRIEFIVNGTIVHQETYVTADDSRDYLEWHCTGNDDDRLSIRITGLPNSKVQFDSSENMVIIDAYDGTFIVDSTSQEGSFNPFVGFSIIVFNYEAHVRYYFNR